MHKTCKFGIKVIIIVEEKNSKDEHKPDFFSIRHPALTFHLLSAVQIALNIIPKK